MLRTAEEYLDNANGFFYTEDFVYHKESVKKIINEARKEAIEDAAKKVEEYGDLFDWSGDKASSEVRDEILSLINELK